MSGRLVLWVLWTALSLCLPSAARVELCLCDGVGGLFDGRPCGAIESASEAASCCGAVDEGAVLAAETDESPACQCLSLEIEREISLRHLGTTGATTASLSGASSASRVAFAPIRARRSPSVCARVPVPRSVARPLRI